MSNNPILNAGKTIIKNKIERTILNPIDKATDHPLELVATTIGTFVTRWIEGKFQRTITFVVGQTYSDNWMEEALYGILYQYNDIKKSKDLTLSNKKGMNAGSAMYYKLGDGPHNLKYRDYDIVLHITTKNPTSITGRTSTVTEYTIITMNLSKEFVTQFERDMIAHRNSLLKIRSDSPVVNVYQDYHEGDGYTYWDQINTVNKRRIGTVYLPYEQKKRIVDTVNDFFANKDYYREHGIPHNLKILLYGPPGPQPKSAIIPTPNGDRRMGDLNPGDEVFDITGRVVKIGAVIDYDPMDVYKVTFGNDQIVLCAEDHQFQIMKFSGNKGRGPLVYKKLNVKEIRKLVRNREQIFTPLGKDAEYPTKDLPVEPFIVGSVLAATYSIRPKKILDSSIAGGTDPDYMAWLEDQITQIKSMVSKSHFIPDDYRYGDLNQRLCLLSGIFSTEDDHGPVRSNPRIYNVYFTTKEKNLANDIIEVVRSIGLPSSKVYNEDIQSWCVYIETDVRTSNKDVFINPCGDVIQWDNGRHLYLSTVESVEKMHYQEEMRCLNLDSETHMYLTTDYIPCFNSGKDSIAKMIASEWNRNIYYITGGKEGRFIPNALSDNGDSVNFPLFLISDIDKYPYLINEPDVSLEKKEDSAKDDTMRYKQLFGNMINALDGVMSGEDKIIVMTTNHIEKFSDAILRPGRIDLKLEIGYVTPEVFRDYTKKFYGIDLPTDITLKSKELTVAMLQADVVFMKLTADEFLKKYLK